MIMKNFTLCLLLLVSSAVFAQKSPISFESDGLGGKWTWNVFENDTNPALEIIENPDKSGINTSSKVAKFTALKSGQPWAGCESLQGTDLGTFQWNDTNRVVKIMVWKSVISPVGIKFDTETGWSQGEKKVTNTKINQWEELVFDFSEYTNPPAGNGTLGRIVIFPDFDLDGRDQSNIVYFDNISFQKATVAPVVPSAAAPSPPARTAADLLSIFSGAYANITGTDFNPGWGQSTLVSTINIQENPTLKYASFNYQGTQFATPLNVTEMNFLHLDMWTSNATSVNVFCISTGPVEKAYPLVITLGQWVSYDIPLTAFAGVNLADVIQFKFDGGDGTPTVFLDNLYFYKGSGTSPQITKTINFEPDGVGAGWSWNVFENDANPALEIIVNPDKTGINTSATVAKFTAKKAGQPWAGVESKQGVDLGAFAWNDSNRIIKIMVWKPVISDVGIKFDTETGWSQGEKKVANTKINQWEELVFNFSDFNNPPVGNGTLGRIVIFPDFDLDGRDQDNVIYFDNISFNKSAVAPVSPATAAPTPPARATGNVISVFSGAYADVTGTDFNPNWGQSTKVSTVTTEGNPTLKYSGFNYQGTQFATPLNVSAMEFLHVDMWTANATAVNVFLISTGPVEKAYTLPITPGQWISYDIPLTTFTNVNLADVIQFKFDGGDGSPTVYLDNLYLYKIPTSTSLPGVNILHFYPNPVRSGLSVKLGVEASQIDLFDITGKLIRSEMNTSSFKTDGIEPGIYLLRMHSRGGIIQTSKLMVQ
jgi:hypothetical protein